MVALDSLSRGRQALRPWLAALAAVVSFGASAQQLTENFDAITTLPGAGWVLTNNSAPVGTSGWFQGNPGVFTAQAGATNSYIAANYLNAAAGGNVSNWLLTPPLTNLQNGQTLSFYTRSAGTFPDGLEVRLCTGTPCTNVGATDTSLGSFTTVLATVPPAGSYPTTWTQVSVVLSGLPAGPNNGRIAFRYVVTNTSTNGDYIGIDTLNLTGSLPDMTVAKSHVGNFVQGQTGATYTITVSNGGGSDTAGTVTLVDTLPTGLTATALAGTGWTCTVGTLTCTRSDVLVAAASYPVITLTVDVATNAAASLTNTATVSGGGEVNAGNNVANDLTTVLAGPDLAIVKTHAGSFSQGQTGATYTITTSNVGSTPTVGVVSVVDTLPAGLTATVLAGTGWTCSVGTLSCTRADALAGAASYPAITLTVNVAISAAASVINTATVSGGGDVNAGNNVANDTTVVVAVPPDLAIVKSHAGNFTQGQTGATYTITVSNVGAVPTVGTVSVVDTMPSGLTATALAGTGWTCSVGTLTCTRADALAGAASYPAITLTVNVAANAAASVINTATVSGGGDVNAGNNSSSNPTTVQPFVAPPTTVTNIPTLGEFALLLMAAMIALLAMPALRRRR